VTLLETVHGPEDLKRLAPSQLPVLAAEVRDFMVDTVSKTGGHLGPSLGVVEMTIALHRVFDSPRDKVLWDTGHQSYPHKILTGRAGQFDTLRKKGGLSGYPSRGESAHDVVENSHASTALSYADGLSKAYRLRGEDRHVVAVVGDGALTGGMCWEALNNIAAGHLPVVVVVNDNGRSYSPTIGGLAEHLASLRMTPQYEQALDTVRTVLNRTPLVGPPLYEALHGMKRGLKDFLQPQVLFEDLGLKYVGPIDGHDTAAMEAALRRAKAFGGPVIVHAVTSRATATSPPSTTRPTACTASGVIDPGHRQAAEHPARPAGPGIFSDEVVAIGAERPDVVAITAAMLQPVGLHAFSQALPERTFDVGIAEQHAVTAPRAGDGRHAPGGLPVRHLPQPRLRPDAHGRRAAPAAGHLRARPRRHHRRGRRQPQRHVGHEPAAAGARGCGWRLRATARQLRELLREAVAVTDGPTAVRFPKGAVGDDVPAVDRVGPLDVLRREAGRRRAARGRRRDGAAGPRGRRARRRPGHRRHRRRPALGLTGRARARRAGPRLPPGGHGRGQRPHRRRRLDGVAGAARRRRRRAGPRPRHPAALPRPRLARQLQAEVGLTAQEVARRVVETVARLDGSLEQADGAGERDDADRSG
jgi:1-deoxy-D-xylulose-5-phosphate synthase